MNPLDNFKCDWKCSQLAKTLCVFVPRHPVEINVLLGFDCTVTEVPNWCFILSARSTSAF